MVQVRDLHVDKVSDTAVDWQAMIDVPETREALTVLDQKLTELSPKAHETCFKAREMVLILSDLKLETDGLLAALCVPYFDAGIVTKRHSANCVSLKSLKLVADSSSNAEHLLNCSISAEASQARTTNRCVRRMLLAMVEDVRAVFNQTGGAYLSVTRGEEWR